MSAYIDNLPLPIKKSSCYFDGDKYRCPWDQLAAVLESNILAKGVNVEDVCFSHLENRSRPQIVDTNMPWWLATVIAGPLVAGTTYALHRYRLYKQQKKQREQEAHYRGLAAQI